MSNWQVVYKTEQGYKAEMVRSLLEEKGFSPVIISKKDSSLNNFGSYEIRISPDEVMAAIKYIENDIDIK
jgi:hypothetical protein